MVATTHESLKLARIMYTSIRNTSYHGCLPPKGRCIITLYLIYIHLRDLVSKMPTPGRCPSYGVRYSGISPALQVLLPVSQSVSKEEAERQLLDEYFLFIVYQLTASYGKIHSCNAFTFTKLFLVYCMTTKS